MLIFEGNLRSGEVTEPLHRGLNPFLDPGPGWAEQVNFDDGLRAPGPLLPDALNGAVDQDDRGDPPLGTEDQALVGAIEQLLAITRHADRRAELLPEGGPPQGIHLYTSRCNND
jgi:hypothetical protein